MREAGSNGVSVGLEIARETFLALRHRIQGVYIVPSFDRFEPAGELARELRAYVAADGAA
jgi:homocysteine S-methyltransferase